MEARKNTGLCFSDERERQSFFNEEIIGRERLIGSVVSKILNNPDDIDDAVQECFLLAWSSMDSLKSRDAVVSWLCAIARNVAVNMLREGERNTVSLSEPVGGADSEGLVWSDALVSHVPGPEEIAIARLTTLQMEMAFKMLPMQYRLQLYLRCYMEMEAAEINRLLGIDESTRRNACFRAKQAVRRNYERLQDK